MTHKIELSHEAYAAIEAAATAQGLTPTRYLHLLIMSLEPAQADTDADAEAKAPTDESLPLHDAVGESR